MAVDYSKILSKEINDKLKLIKILNDSKCEFVQLKELIRKIKENIFNNKPTIWIIQNILYSDIYKECNKLYLNNEHSIKNINDYDIIQISYKNKLYNYTTIKIKIEEHLTNDQSPFYIKFKKILKKEG